jgi:hypothetical protein
MPRQSNSLSRDPSNNIKLVMKLIHLEYFIQSHIISSLLGSSSLLSTPFPIIIFALIRQNKFHNQTKIQI